MNRNSSIVLALAVAATAAVRIPTSPAKPTPVQAQAARSSLHHSTLRKAAPTGGYSGGCTAYDPTDEKAQPDENRSAAKAVLDKFFATPPEQETANTLRSEPGVRYAIALTADPRHTNLSLVFDRQMAVIQQAAQDESYTYDSSWLPWQTNESNYPLLTDQQAEEDLAGHREACPGVLLFRKSASEHGPAAADAYRQALVVLVVGEQPTRGLNEDQWQNAVRWLARNASDRESDGKSRVLRVLGPSFSGTLVSLGRDLSQLYPAQPDSRAPSASFAARFPEARVLSGSVSDCASVSWFQKLRWASVAAPAQTPGSAQASSQPQASVPAQTSSLAQTVRLAQPLRPAVVFGSFEENDDRQIYSFLSYLGSQGTKANDVAILSEDETAYSGGPAASTAAEAAASQTSSASQPCAFPYASEHRPVRLFFPRDISALRNAYEKASIFNTSSTAHGEHSAHTVLQEGGEASDDADNASDTIQPYSHHLTPLVQEAVLYGLVSYMRAHHTRYLMLRCSNPLDFLFLTRFFHRAYPEGRIVTVGSDLLFRRDIETTEFRGVFSLSNYPLLPRNQHWSMLSERDGFGPGHAHLAFETGTVQGTYLAARYLFSNGGELADPQAGSTSIALPFKESLPEYADPFWLHAPGDVISTSHAPIWLVVVGVGGYWPVAVLNDTSTPYAGLEKNKKEDARKPPPPSTIVRLVSSSAHYDRSGNGKHFTRTLRSQLPLPWTLCALAATFLLGYQAFGITVGDRNSSNGLFSVFRQVAAPSQSILLGLNSALAAMPLLAILGIGATFPPGDMFATSDIEYTTFLVLGLCALMALLVGLVIKRGWLATGCFAAVFAVLAGLSLWTLRLTMVVSQAGGLAGGEANRVPLFYRMGHVTDGVAPLLPVLFILLGVYLWSWHAMAGNVLLCNGRPMLPRLADVEAKRGWARWYWSMLGNPVAATGAGWHRLKWPETRMSQETGKRICEMASPVSLRPEVIGLPLGLLAVLLFCFHADLPLVSMEGRAFSLWLNIGLLLAFMLIAGEVSRLFWTWIRLRRLLSKLNRVRLRRTFARLRAVEASSLWGMSGNVQRVQYLFFAQQLEAATRLAALTPPRNWPALQDVLDCGQVFDSRAALHGSPGARWDRPIFRPRDLAQVTIRDVFSDAVAETLNRILCPWWAREATSLNLATAAAAAKGEEESAALPDLPLSEEPIIRAAEEFVCFHYIAFIQNILARMRTMTLSMVLLFVAISLAISFYPFVPRTQIGMWMIVGLSMIGSAVIYVYAGMDRDPIMSYITNTRPGKLSGEFWLKTAAFLAGPVIGIITTQFPAVADSVLGWVQPGLDAIGK